MAKKDTENIYKIHINQLNIPEGVLNGNTRIADTRLDDYIKWDREKKLDVANNEIFDYSVAKLLREGGVDTNIENGRNILLYLSSCYRITTGRKICKSRSFQLNKNTQENTREITLGQGKEKGGALINRSPKELADQLLFFIKGTHPDLLIQIMRETHGKEKVKKYIPQYGTLGYMDQSRKLHFYQGIDLEDPEKKSAKLHKRFRYLLDVFPYLPHTFHKVFSKEGRQQAITEFLHEDGPHLYNWVGNAQNSMNEVHVFLFYIDVPDGLDSSKINKYKEVSKDVYRELLRDYIAQYYHKLFSVPSKDEDLFGSIRMF